MIYSRPILETFLEVCRHRNFSEAAVVLRKSQACVSMQISQIEREIGLTLFNRTTRPLALTDAGTKFAEFARAITSTMDECRTYMKEMTAGSAGEIRIGTLPSLVTLLVAPPLANIVKMFPKTHIQINAFAPPALYEALRQGEIDFGILLAENTPAEFAVAAIGREPLLFVSSATHPITQRRRPISIRDLRDTPFVLGSPRNDYTTLIDQSLRAIGLHSYHAAVRISNFEGMKMAIRSGIGVGILPRFAVQEELKQGSLERVHVRGAKFSSRLVLIESRKMMSLPTVENIKRIFVETIAKRPNPAAVRTATMETV